MFLWKINAKIWQISLIGLNKMEKSQSLDGLSIEFLERTGTEMPPVTVQPEILAEAGRYHINLDSLENVDVPADFPSQADVNPVQNVQEENKAVISRFLQETDVPLMDVANKVFSRSDRPIVIVRDDKIEYINKTFMTLLDVKNEAELLHEKFLKLVVREDWNFLAENIGAMLTNNETAVIRLVGANHKVSKVKFEAIYLSDNQHFTFILMGERIVPKTVTAMSMYDSVTGLPNFYLFEDRVQTAVNYENYKDVRQRKNMIAVVGVSIDNFAALKNLGLHELVLRKLAEKLMLSLKKIYTVASGLKYQFWILMPDVTDEETLKVELQKIQNILAEPVADNFTEHDISASVGVSIYPEPGSSAKKLIEQAIMAVQKAQREGGRRTQVFGI